MRSNSTDPRSEAARGAVFGNRTSRSCWVRVRGRKARVVNTMGSGYASCSVFRSSLQDEKGGPQPVAVRGSEDDLL